MRGTNPVTQVKVFALQDYGNSLENSFTRKVVNLSCAGHKQPEASNIKEPQNVPLYGEFHD